MSEEQKFYKELPCGMVLEIKDLGYLLEAHLINLSPAYSAGAYFQDGNKNHLVIFIMKESLPALREALNHFAPAPRKWYQFWKS